MGHTQEKPASGGMNISVKSFITAIAMLAALMVLTYVLTFFVPAVALILMASSVRYTLEQAHILDTVLNAATQLTQHMPKGATALFLYALVLVMNFFISSGSAKAFLLMPLITPIADLCGLSRQVSILAFAFGDGFSNVFYFTNPVLLISLGLVGVGYGAWARWSGKFQLIILAVTGGILMLASAVM